VLQRLKLRRPKLQSLKNATKNRWFWRGLTALVLVFIVLLGTVTARLFIWPATGSMPANVDAIVVLGGPGDRVDYAMPLARENKAPYLVFSKGLGWLPPGICTEHVGSATVICFQPNPDTTQGESEAFAKLAKQYSWHSVALVTSQEQAWRQALVRPLLPLGPVLQRRAEAPARHGDTERRHLRMGCDREGGSLRPELLNHASQ